MERARRGPVEPTPSMLRGFVILRVVVVSTLLVSALLIQLTFNIGLPLNLIYYLAAFAFTVSIAAVVTVERIPPEANAALQILGDVALVTGLVYVSHGPDSGFTFLYLSAITAGVILLGRRGGLITAGIAAIFYAVLVDLMAIGVLPLIESPDVPARIFTTSGLITNVALNVAAFFATALLVGAAADKLHDARAALARRNAEVARLQALHSSVLSSMTAGVLTTDRDGTVTYANPTALDLLARPAEQLVGTPVQELGLLDEATWAIASRSEAEILRSEGNGSVRGPEIYFGVSVTPLRDGGGRITGRIFIFQNLTELKRLEGEVRLKEKMAAVGELAAGIAHEIRNPLASISGSAQVLRGGSSPGSSERRLMEIVVSESQRLSTILEDFLKYVKPRERVVENVDAAAALRDVATLLSHSDERGPGHRIVVDIQPESVVLPADPGQLRQIFWNLSRNALAAMPDGGTLTIAARLDGGSWIVSTRDEGRGMTPEERDRLFTPFAHSFRGGTGLGLAIVYRIVEEHAGSIRVDTAEGRGTTISIALPLREAAAGREVA